MITAGGRNTEYGTLASLTPREQQSSSVFRGAGRDVLPEHSAGQPECRDGKPYTPLFGMDASGWLGWSDSGRCGVRVSVRVCVRACAGQVSRGHALSMNIASAKGLEDVVKSNLGPKGTLKM